MFFLSNSKVASSAVHVSMDLSHLNIAASLLLNLSDDLRLAGFTAKRDLLELVATLLERDVEHL